MTRKKISAHLTAYWWVYILVAIAVIIVWILTMDAAVTPSGTKLLSIYTYGGDFLNDSLQEDIEASLPDWTDQNVEKVSVGSVDDELYDPTYLDSVLYVRGQQSDFVIVSDDVIATEFGSSYFNAVDEDAVTAALGDVTFYREMYGGEEYTFGIQVYGEGWNNNFSRYYTGTCSCYIFFCFKTDNMGGMIGDGDAANDAALKTISWLLEEV